MRIKVLVNGKVMILKFKIKNNINDKKIQNEFKCTTLKQEDGTNVNYKIQQGLIEIE